jgi:Cof subfamily protein (haloacid dehalogenase superfamily)
MNRRVSLVVSDVDGTLVTHDKVLTPRTIAAVERLHDAGIHFSICSSRPPFGLRMMIEPLRLKLPFGGYNAGAIVEPVLPGLPVIEQKLIAPDVARETAAIFSRYGVDCWIFTGNRWLVTNPDGDHVARETRTVQTPPTVVPEFDGSHFSAVGKIVGPSNDHALIARLTDLMQAALSGRANAARSQPYYCDVIPPGIDKGRLVVMLAERLAVPISEVLVLGDMENDLQMFSRAGFAVAMGNASDAVQSRAQAVTLSNDEDGVAAAIDRYVFGKS